MNKRIVLYIICGLLITGLLVMTFFPNVIYVFRDSGSDGGNICTLPPGQTEESWKEHMSHHPNIYGECLN